MTDTEASKLNEATARAMGWKLTGEYSKVNTALQIVTPPDGFSRFGLPDFCRDVMALGYIAEWFWRRGLLWEVHQGLSMCWAEVWLRGKDDLKFTGIGATPGEACCWAISHYAEVNVSAEQMKPSETNDEELGNAIGSTVSTVEEQAHWTPEMQLLDMIAAVKEASQPPGGLIAAIRRERQDATANQEWRHAMWAKQKQLGHLVKRLLADGMPQNEINTLLTTIDAKIVPNGRRTMLSFRGVSGCFVDAQATANLE